MKPLDTKAREKAFRLRLQNKSFRQIAGELGICARTVSRWESGWTDKKGRRHAGWKGEIERSFQESASRELQQGLMAKEARLQTYEELARMAVAKVKQMFPQIRGKSALDAKALLSEIRELCKLIATERGDMKSGPQTVVAVKTDITLNELQDRYRSAHADREQGTAQPGGNQPLAGDDPGVPGGTDRD